MYPHGRSLVTEMKGRPFALIGVNSDSLERAKEAVIENDLNWRSFQNAPKDSDKKHSDDWFVSGWPTVVVLDAQRNIHYRGHDGHEATEIAKRLVAELEAAKK